MICARVAGVPSPRSAMASRSSSSSTSLPAPSIAPSNVASEKRGAALVCACFTSISFVRTRSPACTATSWLPPSPASAASRPYTSSQPAFTSTLPSLLNGSPSTREMTRVGARVGQHLVFLIKRLCDAQRVLGGETETPIAVALQACQVEKQRRKLGARLAFIGNHGRFAKAFGFDRLGLRLFPDSL